MKRPGFAFLVVLLLAAAGWGSAAYWRRAAIRSEVAAAIQARHPNADVRVPIVPLLVNPLRSDPKVYLFERGHLAAEFDYASLR